MNTRDYADEGDNFLRDENDKFHIDQVDEFLRVEDGRYVT